MARACFDPKLESITTLPLGSTPTFPNLTRRPRGLPARGYSVGLGELGMPRLLSLAFGVVLAFVLLSTNLGRDRALPAAGDEPFVWTIAGNGLSGYSGDNGQAVQAMIAAAVGGVDYDAAGNLYIADDWNNRVRRVGTNGIITTIAGTGAAGYTGDGGLATNATLHSPRGVAIDSNNNIYIADRDNSVVRKINAAGTISTFHAIVGPDAVVVDGSNNVVVLSGFEHTIRVLSPAGATLRTITVGTGDAQIGIGGLAVDTAGVIYNTNAETERVIRIDVNGVATSIAGTGIEGYAGDGALATTARFWDIGGIAVDVAGTLEPAGTVFVSDRGNARVRAFVPGGTIRTVAGTGVAAFCGEGVRAAFSSLEGPWSMTFSPAGDLAFIDNTRIRLLTDTLVPPPGPTPTPCATPTPTATAPTPLPTATSTPNLFTPTATPTSTPTLAGTPGDTDGDGVPNASDNCPGAPNANQLNTDAAPLFGAPPVSPPEANPPPNDATRPKGDGLGDVCDPDDDNDGLFDAVEAQTGVPSPPGPCVSATGPLNSLELDSDGDRVHDGAECALGSDGMNSASVPMTCAQMGQPDADGDRLCNAFEATLGSSPNDSDSDDDGIADGVEYRGYATNLMLADSDADACGDSLEIMSVDLNRVVNSNDLLIIAVQFGRPDRPVQDIDKNGSVNSADLLLTALHFNESC